MQEDYGFQRFCTDSERIHLLEAADVCVLVLIGILLFMSSWKMGGTEKWGVMLPTNLSAVLIQVVIYLWAAHRWHGLQIQFVYLWLA